jgi:protocatechuate 3,4-dioxygenase beta subunit
VVRAGEYATTADHEGRYGFHNLPPGQYEITLDADGLSADHAWDGRGTRVDTRRQHDETVVLHVAPLATLTGRVFVDRNGDGSYSAGEEVSGASLFLDDGRGTTTDRFGTYGFYNLRPGDYRIRLEPRSLTATARPSAWSIYANLVSDRPVTGLDFVLHPVERPVLWSERR